MAKRCGEVLEIDADHFVWLDNSETIPDLIEEFLTGEPSRPRDVDRILTTIVFTDIVDSTRRLAEMGKLLREPFREVQS